MLTRLVGSPPLPTLSPRGPADFCPNLIVNYVALVVLKQPDSPGESPAVSAMNLLQRALAFLRFLVDLLTAFVCLLRW